MSSATETPPSRGLNRLGLGLEILVLFAAAVTFVAGALWSHAQGFPH